MDFIIKDAKLTISGNQIIIDCGNVDPQTLFKNQIEVGMLNLGDTFFKNSEEFTILDKMPGGKILVIKSGLLSDSYIFGENNDWRKSPIRSDMNSGKVYQHMCELFGSENIQDMCRDLASLDGLDDYGTCVDRVSMLTAAEYAKYHKILGVMSHYDKAWWTITAISTPSNDYSGDVCGVSSDGILVWDYCGWSYGVRPVLTLSSSTLVSNKE